MAGGAEAGDRGGIACAGLVGLKGCSALRRECDQVFGWRKLYRDEARAPADRSASQLIPVVVTAEPGAVVTQPVEERIEIDVASKYRVCVGGGVDAQALRRLGSDFIAACRWSRH
jgi:hypothetical protein